MLVIVSVAVMAINVLLVASSSTTFGSVAAGQEAAPATTMSAFDAEAKAADWKERIRHYRNYQIDRIGSRRSLAAGAATGPGNDEEEEAAVRALQERDEQRARYLEDKLRQHRRRLSQYRKAGRNGNNGNSGTEAKVEDDDDDEEEETLRRLVRQVAAFEKHLSSLRSETREDKLEKLSEYGYVGTGAAGSSSSMTSPLTSFANMNSMDYIDFDKPFRNDNDNGNN